MKFKSLLLVGTTMALAACSGGGGGGSSSSTSGKASGPLSIPNATCGGNPCMGSASLMATEVSTSALQSGQTIFNLASIVYTHFTGTVIPGVNAALYRVEQVAADNGLTTCDAIEKAGDDSFGVGNTILDFPLGGGYSVDISKDANDLKTIPTPMIGSGTNMVKRFVFSNAGTKFAEVQIKCNSAERTLYVRVQESSSRVFEFWSQSDGNKRILYGAMDNGSSEKTTFYFNTADGNAFQLHGVAKQVPLGGALMDFSMAGGANLSAGKADIAYVQSDAVPTAVSHSDDDNSTVHSRHCYSSISSVTVESASNAPTTCSGLLTAAGAENAVRSGTAWKLTGMASAISTSF